jgi:RNase P subunit RPR2
MRVTVMCQDCGAKHRAPIEMSVRFFSCLRCGWPVRVPKLAPTERDPAIPAMAPGAGDDLAETVEVRQRARGRALVGV